MPNCPLLLSWCQIVRFIILVPNCPVPNCPTIPLNPDLEREHFYFLTKTLAFHSSSIHGINLNNLFSSAKVSEQGMGRRSSITDKMRGPRHHWSCFYDKLSSSNWQDSQIIWVVEFFCQVTSHLKKKHIFDWYWLGWLVSEKRAHLWDHFTLKAERPWQKVGPSD